MPGKGELFCPSANRAKRKIQETKVCQPHFISWENCRKVLRKATDSNIVDKKVTGRSQHGFTKGKPCWTNLVAFYDETTC